MSSSMNHGQSQRETPANTIKWDDGRGNRGRMPWLILAKGDSLHRFVGAQIHGICEVLEKTHRQAGQWSATTFTLLLYPGVRSFPGYSGWENATFREGLHEAILQKCLKSLPTNCWQDVANVLGVSLDVCKAFVRGNWPADAKHFDAYDAAVARVEQEAEEGATIVVFNWGSPTRRAEAEGYWQRPIEVVDEERRIIASFPQTDAQPGKSFAGGLVQILDKTAIGAAGMIRVAVPYGASIQLGAAPPPLAEEEIKAALEAGMPPEYAQMWPDVKSGHKRELLRPAASLLRDAEEKTGLEDCIMDILSMSFSDWKSSWAGRADHICTHVLGTGNCTVPRLRALARIIDQMT